MRTASVALLSISIGAAGGYFARGWLGGDATVGHEPRVHGDVVACTLSPEQIEHLSARIAPAVVERLGSPGVVAPDPQRAAQLRAADEKARQEQAAAFDEAARLVDQMIANRAVTPQGRERAHQLLRESGQADRIFEIDGRIAVAINRGEITAADAGLAPSTD
ncbi:MAG TPA: hypothetical protein VFZ95_04950 [Steroidobacteraceae bacterium]